MKDAPPGFWFAIECAAALGAGGVIVGYAVAGWLKARRNAKAT